MCARVITLCSMVFFAACGTTVKIEGNADRVWAVTLSTLRVAHAMSDADERQASEGGVPSPTSPSELTEFIRAEIAKYEKIAKAAQLKMDQ